MKNHIHTSSFIRMNSKREIEVERLKIVDLSTDKDEFEVATFVEINTASWSQTPTLEFLEKMGNKKERRKMKRKDDNCSEINFRGDNAGNSLTTQKLEERGKVMKGKGKRTAKDDNGSEGKMQDDNAGDSLQTHLKSHNKVKRMRKTKNCHDEDYIPAGRHPKNETINAESSKHYNTRSSVKTDDAGFLSSSAHTVNFEQFTNPYELASETQKNIEAERSFAKALDQQLPHGSSSFMLSTKNYDTQQNKKIHSPEKTKTPTISVHPLLQDLFEQQAAERYQMQMNHLIQKQNFVLSVEQEALREHGKKQKCVLGAPMNLSSCSILIDEQHMLGKSLPQHEDINGRSFKVKRYWASLYELKTKWTEIKESLIYRQRCEAEALYIAQSIKWQGNLNEFQRCLDPKLYENFVQKVVVTDW